MHVKTEKFTNKKEYANNTKNHYDVLDKKLKSDDDENNYEQNNSYDFDRL